MSTNIEQRPLPGEALLNRYAGDYTDCFVAVIPQPVSLEHFVVAFYTSWLFRLERRVLVWLAKKPSTDAEAVAVANGTTDRFAAWVVEARAGNQLLLKDFRGETRSWFMVEPGERSTRLLFGSAITAKRGEIMPRSYRWLLPLHRLYSRLLLRAASSRLRRDRGYS